MHPKANHVCPLCGGPNDCAPARSGCLDTPCWCEAVIVDAATIARIPAAARGEACICRRCAAAPAPALAPGGGRSPLLALVEELGALLAQAKHLLEQEIRGYPTPIPRCDAQFNFLYEQRGRLAQQLAEIGAVTGGDAAASSARRILDEFLRSPPASDLPAERALRARAAAWLTSAAP